MGITEQGNPKCSSQSNEYIKDSEHISEISECVIGQLMESPEHKSLETARNNYSNMQEINIGPDECNRNLEYNEQYISNEKVESDNKSYSSIISPNTAELSHEGDCNTIKRPELIYSEDKNKTYKNSKPCLNAKYTDNDHVSEHGRINNPEKEKITFCNTQNIHSEDQSEILSGIKKLASQTPVNEI